MSQQQVNRPAGEVLVEMRNMVKVFGPVVALGGVDITVRRGQVLGLIGENGSGKSTVSSILAGMQPADSGEMLYLGKPWHPVSMHDALRQGIGMIVQENGTVPGITVAENLFLCDTARFSGKRGRGLINGRALRRAAQAALDDIGASHIRADSLTGSLDLQDRKLAGILVELTGKTGDAAQIVIGAGINMAMRRVEESVVNQGWITLQEAGINLDRNTLAAMLIRELRAALELFEQEGLAPYLSRWEKLDNFINRPVKLIIGDKEIFGISRGIDKQGALLLEQDGIIKPWMGGEISLRSAEK